MPPLQIPDDYEAARAQAEASGLASNAFGIRNFVLRAIALLEMLDDARTALHTARALENEAVLARVPAGGALAR